MKILIGLVLIIVCLLIGVYISNLDKPFDDSKLEFDFENERGTINQAGTIIFGGNEGNYSSGFKSDYEWTITDETNFSVATEPTTCFFSNNENYKEVARYEYNGTFIFYLREPSEPKKKQKGNIWSIAYHDPSEITLSFPDGHEEKINISELLQAGNLETYILNKAMKDITELYREWRE